MTKYGNITLKRGVTDSQVIYQWHKDIVDGKIGDKRKSISIVVIRYFKLKERELAVEMEYRDKAHQQQLALEERLRRIEDALSTDPEMRARLGIEEPATPLPSRGA